MAYSSCLSKRRAYLPTSPEILTFAVSSAQETFSLHRTIHRPTLTSSALSPRGNCARKRLQQPVVSCPTPPAPLRSDLGARVRPTDHPSVLGQARPINGDQLRRGSGRVRAGGWLAGHRDRIGGEYLPTAEPPDEGDGLTAPHGWMGRTVAIRKKSFQGWNCLDPRLRLTGAESGWLWYSRVSGGGTRYVKDDGLREGGKFEGAARLGMYYTWLSEEFVSESMETSMAVEDMRRLCSSCRWRRRTADGLDRGRRGSRWGWRRDAEGDTRRDREGGGALGRGRQDRERRRGGRRRGGLFRGSASRARAGWENDEGRRGRLR
ncbi:uncharacterized protein J3D65DRAFT_620464 [Phyllosticta citribraziliensis]|uniref:Uncharacterized protein n=1 Tax=Phyllosticta citribraziliensis TaxID=989973 RepID=A0ABR1LXT9_9PEZI